MHQLRLTPSSAGHNALAYRKTRGLIRSVQDAGSCSKRVSLKGKPWLNRIIKAAIHETNTFKDQPLLKHDSQQAKLLTKFTFLNLVAWLAITQEHSLLLSKKGHGLTTESIKQAFLMSLSRSLELTAFFGKLSASFMKEPWLNHSYSQTDFPSQCGMRFCRGFNFFWQICVSIKQEPWPYHTRIL